MPLIFFLYVRQGFAFPQDGGNNFQIEGEAQWQLSIRMVDVLGFDWFSFFIEDTLNFPLPLTYHITLLENTNQGYWVCVHTRNFLKH